MNVTAENMDGSTELRNGSNLRRRAARFATAVTAVGALTGSALIAMGVSPASAAVPTTWYVAPSGSGSEAGCASNSATAPFATVQAALACAADGDVVSLAASAGTPYPGVGLVSHSVTIKGGSARSVLIDVSQPADDAATGAAGGEMTVAPGVRVLLRGVTVTCTSHQCLHPNVTNHGALTIDH